MRAAALALVLVGSTFVGVGVADHAQGGVTFDHKGGNEWWVEVSVAGSVTAVEARDDGGSWKALTKRSWGPWAASFHIEPGHMVYFRATTSGGAVVESCAFTHPAGSERCATNPVGFDATFSSVKGNEWWIQAKVQANEPLAGVDARVVDGAWKALTLRSWGAWAGSFHMPSGSHVELRARSADGDVDLSGRYLWPSATPIDGGGTMTWPVEGSFLRVDATDMDSSTPGGSMGEDVTVTYRYKSGQWERTCEGTSFSTYGTRSAEDWQTWERGVAPPAPSPKSVTVGQTVRVEWIEGCWHNAMNATVTGSGERTVYRNGQPMKVKVWIAEKQDLPNAAHFVWEQSTGILLQWSECGGSYTGCDSGRYENSDAPLQGTATTETGNDRHGRFAKYAVSFVEDDSSADDEDVSYAYTLTTRYEYGQWETLCEGTIRQRDYSGAVVESRYYEKTWGGPILLPATASSGSRVDARYPETCWSGQMEVVAKGRFPEDTTKNGAFFRARVVWADEPDSVDAAGGDRDAWWDAGMGLLIRWERDEMMGTMRWTGNGKLLDTNLPLTAY